MPRVAARSEQCRRRSDTINASTCSTVTVAAAAAAMSLTVEVALVFHSVLKVVQELLLRAHDAARAADAAESDGFRGGVVKVLHHVQRDVCPGSAEASLAVDGDSSLYVCRRCESWVIEKRVIGGNSRHGEKGRGQGRKSIVMSKETGHTTCFFNAAKNHTYSMYHTNTRGSTAEPRHQRLPYFSPKYARDIARVLRLIGKQRTHFKPTPPPAPGLILPLAAPK